MGAGIWFWILFVVGVIFGGAGAYYPDAKWPRLWPLWVLVLIGLLGWSVYGGPLK